MLPVGTRRSGVRASARRFRTLGLPLFGILLGLLIGELIARSTYTKPWYVRLVEQAAVNENWMDGVQLNRFGLRDRDYPALKPPNTRRVLLLGDSFTFGYGLADDNAVSARLLERELNADAGGAHVEVMNGGIVASMTQDWVALLEKVSAPFQPDVILVVFFLRDATSTTTMGTYFLPIRREIVRRNGRSHLYRYSYLYRSFKDRIDRRTISQRYTREINDSYTGDSTETSEWRLAQSNLRKIVAMGADIRARVGLVVFPVLADLNANYPFRPAMDAVIAFGEREKIPTLSLLPAFMGRDGPDLWLAPFDQHPNAKGHKIAADAMLPFLRTLLTPSMHGDPTEPR